MQQRSKAEPPDSPRSVCHSTPRLTPGDVPSVNQTNDIVPQRWRLGYTALPAVGPVACAIAGRPGPAALHKGWKQLHDQYRHFLC